MTITGIFNRFLVSIIVPSDGVKPPRKSEEFNSIRSAPPLSASTASSTEPQQTSISILDDTLIISRPKKHTELRTAPRIDEQPAVVYCVSLIFLFFLRVLGDDLLLDVGRDQLVMAEGH